MPGAAMRRPVPMGVYALAGVATFTVEALATLEWVATFIVG